VNPLKNLFFQILQKRLQYSIHLPSVPYNPVTWTEVPVVIFLVKGLYLKYRNIMQFGEQEIRNQKCVVSIK